ncbi:MAG: tRNA uridine-5-carboxymethylaminomethyl(34) synthesis GTPase MnmE [Alphaproteobacteria bacterium]|nr:tRNA uridine-5-carboxymethylaminomethyl(34) synthesis GTPase MnmE [Alphaproteobacteria bacterium]
MSAQERRDPILAPATPPGRGAVGMVRISGTDLSDFAQVLMGRPLTPRHAHHLPLRDEQGQPIDQVIVLYFQAPHSYTGEDVLEIQGHGGPVVMQMIVRRCMALAAQPLAGGSPRLAHLRAARPGEFTERAFLNHKLDLAQAEAVADLIDASTERAARGASRSLSGEFSRDIQALLDDLTHLRMLIEACLDFPEEDIDFVEQADARGQLNRLSEHVAETLRRSRQGALLREGIRVVIAGQPNAGKSSLLNALAGAERAIVTSVAGTTRDVLSETLSIDGVPLHIIDTAGLRTASDTQVDVVEKIGIERAWAQMEQADAVLLLSDITQVGDAAHQSRDHDIEDQLRQRLRPSVPVLRVWNKTDALPTGSAKPVPGLTISAQTGLGMDELRQGLLELAGWEHQAGEGLFMARERHLQALRRVEEHLAQAQVHLPALDDDKTHALDLLAEELRLAQVALGQITGAFDADDLLGVIFSRFCIGK